MAGGGGGGISPPDAHTVAPSVTVSRVRAGQFINRRNQASSLVTRRREQFSRRAISRWLTPERCHRRARSRLVSSAQATATRTISRGVSTHSRAQEMVVIGSVVGKTNRGTQASPVSWKWCAGSLRLAHHNPCGSYQGWYDVGAAGWFLLFRPVGLVVSEALGVIVKGFAFGAGSR